MKKLLFLALVFITISSKAQLMIPLFDAPQKVDRLSDGAEEQTPITFNNGEGMFFNRFYQKIDEDGGVMKAQDIWYSSYGKKGWENPYRAFRDVDGREIKILIGCTRDGERLYLLDRYFEGDSIHHRIVYKTRSGKSTWKDPVEIVIPGIDLSDQQTTLFMHSDEDVLLVSMLSKDTSSTPNEDLYLTYKKEDGNWSELIDLGPNINTKGLEFSPFLTHDKKALYFASNGHEGLGESDIFVSYREEGRWDKWSRPLNLGMPINSTDFESSFVISDTNQVYFSSDRGDNNTNMYFTKSAGAKMANLGILSGKFVINGEPIAAAKISAYDLNSELIETVTTDNEGKFVFKKLRPDDKYEIKLEEEIEEKFVGSKLYLVNQDGKLMKRIIFDETGSNSDGAATKEVLSGVIAQGGTPLMNTAIVIQDENGFPIDTVYTNDVGQFNYTKLSTDTELFFVPRDLAVDEDGLDLYLVDEVGNRTATYVGDKADVNNVFGKFSYKKQPFANTAILVIDEDGNVIDTIYTNPLGTYKYHKLGTDDISFLPVDQDDLDMEDLVLEEIDKEGNSLMRLAFDKSSGLFKESAEDTELVFGKFLYKKQPFANKAILVLDEKGDLINTIYTSQVGVFQYEKLGMDVVSFMPSDLGDMDMEDLVLEEIDKEGRVMKKLTYNKDTGFYTEIESDAGIVDLPKDKEEPKGKEVESIDAMNLNFGFNQAFLGMDNSKKLSKLIKMLKSNNSLMVNVSGHTDNVGSDEVNMRISKKRAQAVKNYLISNGISASKIKVIGMGESKPIESNDTVEGRANNRRAEINIK